MVQSRWKGDRTRRCGCSGVLALSIRVLYKAGGIISFTRTPFSKGTDKNQQVIRLETQRHSTFSMREYNEKILTLLKITNYHKLIGS